MCSSDLRVWREAIDRCLNDSTGYTVNPVWTTELDKVAEGLQHTLGAYHRSWK